MNVLLKLRTFCGLVVEKRLADGSGILKTHLVRDRVNNVVAYVVAQVSNALARYQ